MNSYHDSYVSKQDSIHVNAEHFNDDCELLDLVPEDLENNIPQSVWDLAAPNIAQDDDTTRSHGNNTIQKLTEEQLHDTEIALEATTEHHHDQLAQLYGRLQGNKI